MKEQVSTTTETKMSKSLKNTITLDEVMAKGYHPLDLRYLYLLTHYRKRMTFRWDALKAAKKARRSLRRLAVQLPASASKSNAVIDEFLQAILDDMNTPKAVGIIWTEMKAKTLTPEEQFALLTLADEILAVGIFDEQDKPPQEVVALAEVRRLARSDEQWEVSDQYRDAIKKHGWEIEDTKEGYNLWRIT